MIKSKLMLAVGIACALGTSAAMAASNDPIKSVEQLDCQYLASNFKFALPDVTNVDNYAKRNAESRAMLGEMECKINPERGISDLSAALEDISV